jgi:hypothetical protein
MRLLARLATRDYLPSQALAIQLAFGRDQKSALKCVYKMNVSSTVSIPGLALRHKEHVRARALARGTRPECRRRFCHRGRWRDPGDTSPASNRAPSLIRPFCGANTKAAPARHAWNVNIAQGDNSTPEKQRSVPRYRCARSP